MSYTLTRKEIFIMFLCIFIAGFAIGLTLSYSINKCPPCKITINGDVLGGPCSKAFKSI